MSIEKSKITSDLWNDQIATDEFHNNKFYYEMILEQYKICVEMADRVSARRHLANTLFLSIHTLIIGGIGFSLEKNITDSKNLILLIPLFAALALCFAWWRIVKSYRQLNSAKFKVIGELETRLPSSPYWSAEWKELGEGKNPKLYTPLTGIETWIPFTFGSLYIIGIVVICVQWLILLLSVI